MADQNTIRIDFETPAVDGNAPLHNYTWETTIDGVSIGQLWECGVPNSPRAVHALADHLQSVQISSGGSELSTRGGVQAQVEIRLVHAERALKAEQNRAAEAEDGDER